MYLGRGSAEGSVPIRPSALCNCSSFNWGPRVAGILFRDQRGSGWRQVLNSHCETPHPSPQGWVSPLISTPSSKLPALICSSQEGCLPPCGPRPLARGVLCPTNDPPAREPAFLGREASDGEKKGSWRGLVPRNPFSGGLSC